MPWSEVEAYRLRLYVAGQTPRSVLAFANLRQICEEHLQGRYEIEIIDLLENPQLASGDQILAVPTLVRRQPGPVKKIIGDLSNTERVLAGLDLPAAGPYKGRADQRGTAPLQEALADAADRPRRSETRFRTLS